MYPRPCFSVNDRIKEVKRKLERRKKRNKKKERGRRRKEGKKTVKKVVDEIADNAIIPGREGGRNQWTSVSCESDESQASFSIRVLQETVVRVR